MNIYISHSSGYDYRTDLYDPLKDSELAHEHSFFFPHDHELKNTKEKITTCDLLIAEVSLPSTGQGIEIAWAENAHVPILCIYRSDCSPSSALKLVTDNLAAYANSADMVAKIEQFIQQLKSHR